MSITRFILLFIFALPVLAGVHAMLAMTEISGGFAGWPAAVAVNIALAAAVFAVVLLKSRKV